MRRWPLLLVTILAAACTQFSAVDTTGDQPTTTAMTSTAATGVDPPTVPVALRTDQILEDLDGRLCPESEFTCVTLEMPLDHFDPADVRTIEVTFAVLPASGESRGALVTATGGPGSSGLAVADSYTSALDPAITESYDIVFFDQRGLAMSGGLTCPKATATYYRTDVATGIGVDREVLATAAGTFARECVEEMGDPEILPYLGTDQAASDLEVFRGRFEFEEMILYGESYGTQLAQTYAAAHGEHLTRLILDGTVDLTLDGFTFFRKQAEAFGEVLESTLGYCADDPYCVSDMEIDALGAYDRLAALLAEEPLTGEFPIPGGGFEQRSFGAGDLEVVASAQMYSEDDRMMFLRALAAITAREDLTPMLRLLYLNLGVDPVDGDVVEDPTYSDAIYYAVECLDYWYPGATAEERAAAFFDAGTESEAHRLGVLFYGDLPCAFWPVFTEEPARPPPLTAPGIPTVVLGAVADPATPYEQGVSVSERLEQGYLISHAGGPHVTFGRGNPCPDEMVTAFILDGTPPEETICDGEVVGYYVPLLPTRLDEFDTAEAMFDAVEYEITYLPEYYWWDTYTETAIGCHLGGTITVSATETGDELSFEDCALMEEMTLTGRGSYDYEEDVFTLEVTIGTADCIYGYERRGIDIELRDDCPGDGFTG